MTVNEIIVKIINEGKIAARVRESLIGLQKRNREKEVIIGNSNKIIARVLATKVQQSSLNWSETRLLTGIRSDKSSEASDNK
jgi:hypothetical protein